MCASAGLPVSVQVRALLYLYVQASLCVSLPLNDTEQSHPVILNHYYTVVLLQHLNIVMVTQREGYIMPVRVLLAVAENPQETLCVPALMWSGPEVSVCRGDCCSVGGTLC